MKNGRNRATISSISHLLFTVLAHLVENGGDEVLETGFCFLADGGLWDVWIFLNETVCDLIGLIVEICRGICPGFACRWCRRGEDGIAEGGDSGAIGFIHHVLQVLLQQRLIILCSSLLSVWNGSYLLRRILRLSDGIF